MSSIEKAYVHNIEIPEQATGDQTTPLAKLRCYVNRTYMNQKDEFEDKHGFWIDVELWGKKAHHLTSIQKGASVLITGNMLNQKWTDEDGAKRSRMIFRAKEIAVLPRCIESIRYKHRDETPADELENAA
jgi:single-strand DNA-binding protein